MDVCIKLSFEAQLQQTQRLEYVGTLAGGVDRESNNPINGSMNDAQLIAWVFGAVLLKVTRRMATAYRVCILI
jgi:hypothetical protein